ncbi:D-ribose pyranase [Selenihalanaerobacter shriftii]|uniref:D-ribose pyranase n=1 Tax=Selenihalanaerobacter shriftii TaxID=142842 RepID=A0A1T4JRR9_9FIRM|nr:D-ribose pyranase [Selenihalanaerobacter shriftii]SJZ32767.1 D-ribose pyranase [Selenihalanaerobacter shriftii]
MKKEGILNNNLSKLVAEMGHTDKLVICDAGLPISSDANRIDLALTQGIPKFLDTLKVTLEELVVEKAIVAKEMKEVSPKLYRKTLDILDDIPVEYYNHEKFKKKSEESKGIVRTGETTPYANIILISGVDF